jgi:nucleotide-binding universal stress UspA family protein
MEYGSVLCIAGDSEPLEKTELEAAKIAGMSGGRLILLNVVEKWRNSDFVTTDSPEWKAVHESWLAEAMELLDKKEELLRSQGLYSIKKVVRSGEKAFETITVAVEQNVNLIVVPNYHSWSIKGFLANSFTNDIIAHSPCPVLWVNE